MNPNKNLFEKPNKEIDSIIYKEGKVPLEEKAESAREDSLKRLDDPSTKAIVMDLLERKSLTVIERMSEKDLQNEASNNESQNDYTAAQLLADCQTMQDILDEEEKKKWEKYN